jgi:hypothetical protein
MLRTLANAKYYMKNGETIKLQIGARKLGLKSVANAPSIVDDSNASSGSLTESSPTASMQTEESEGLDISLENSREAPAMGAIVLSISHQSSPVVETTASSFDTFGTPVLHPCLPEYTVSTASSIDALITPVMEHTASASSSNDVPYMTAIPMSNLSSSSKQSTTTGSVQQRSIVVATGKSLVDDMERRRKLVTDAKIPKGTPTVSGLIEFIPEYSDFNMVNTN